MSREENTNSAAFKIALEYDNNIKLLKSQLEEVNRVVKASERKNAASSKQLTELQYRQLKQTALKINQEINNQILQKEDDLQKRKADIQKRWDISRKNSRAKVNSDRIAEEKKVQDNINIQQKKAANSYTSRWKRAFGTLSRYMSAGALIGGAIQFGRSMLTEFLNVEKAIFRISGITGNTIGNTSKLTDTIYGLGSAFGIATDDITAFAIEMAKLGKSSEEIGKLGEATSSLSVILGEDMTTSGKLLVTTMNQFNLVTSEASRVAGVFSNVIKSSPLAVKDLQTAMQYIGTAANAAGIQIEELGEYMTLLSNSGLKASKIGTGLRNVILKLATEGKTFKEVMDDMYESGLSLTDALEKFGRRGATAGYLMVQNWGNLRDIVSDIPSAIDQMTTTVITSGSASARLGKIWAGIKEAVSDVIDYYNDGFVISSLKQDITGVDDYLDKINEAKIAIESLGFQRGQDIKIFDVLYSDGLTAAMKLVTNQLKIQGTLSERTGGVEVLRRRLVYLDKINNKQKELSKRQFLSEENANKNLKRQTELVKLGQLSLDDFNIREGFIDKAFNDELEDSLTTGEMLLKNYMISAKELYEDTELTDKINDFKNTIISSANIAYSPHIDINIDELEKDLQTWKTNAKRINDELASIGVVTDVGVTERFQLTNEDLRKDLIKRYTILCKGGNIGYCMKLCSEFDIGCGSGGKGDPLNTKVIYALLKREIADARRIETEMLDSIPDIGDTVGKLKDIPTASEYFKGRIVNKDEYIALLESSTTDIINQIKSDSERERAAITGSYATQIDALDVARESIQKKYEEELAKPSPDSSKLDKLFADLLKFDADTEKLIEEYFKDFNNTTEKESEAIKTANDSKDSGIASLLKLSDAQKQDILDSVENTVSTILDIYKSWNDEMFNQVNDRLEAEKDSIQNRYDFEKDELRLAAENNLITQEQYSKRSRKLEEDRVRKLNSIAKEQFEKKKKQDLNNIIIDTQVKAAQAFLQALASTPPPLSFALGGIAAGLANIQGVIAHNAIKKRQYSPVTFAEGGLVKGKSHTEGGVPFTVKGVGGYEMEGNEYIIKKDSVTPKTLPILDAINNDKRYNSRYFATGGQVEQTTREAQQTIVRAYITNKDLDAYDRNKSIRNKNKSLF